jgi:peptidoglycan/xylan/chitin deacetylase (PgdA/CDA1 family)
MDFNHGAKEINRLTIIRRGLRQWRRGAPFVVVNFHRVGIPAPSDPFRHLDTISPESFRFTLALLRFFFQVVSLPEVVEGARQTRRPRLVLTFDDISRTFLENALPLLERYHLPVALFPCVRITETGSGWRDLVYYLMDAPDLHPVIGQRVGQVLGQTAVRQLQEQGLYQWTKRLDYRTALVEEEILLPALGEQHRQFEELVRRRQPYLNWGDLKKLAGHPLVTIGSHGTSHHDYRGLSGEEIRRDVSEAQAHIIRHLGFSPQHFSLPFGSHDQRVWQTLDKALPDFGIQTALWCETYANTGRPGESRVLHLSRLNAKSTAFRNLRYVAKALSRPLSSLIAVFPNARLAGEGRFEAKVPEDDYRHIHLLLMPEKRRHQMPEYYAYLFKDNPFRDPADPVHLGLYYEENLEAILSLLWVRFSLRGRPVKGAYVSGWWRLPQIHSQVGTRPFLAMARAASPVLGAYPKANKYSGPLIERDGWQPVSVNRFEGPLTTITRPADYRFSETYPQEIGALLDGVNASVNFSIWRDRRYYEWRFERYPFLKYVYLFDAKPTRSWFALAASDGRQLWLSDFVVNRPADEAVWLEMLSAVAHYLQKINVGQVALETNNDALQRVCASSGLKRKSTFNNYYCFASEILARTDEALSFERGLHETQATGDILPMP